MARDTEVENEASEQAKEPSLRETIDAAVKESAIPERDDNTDVKAEKVQEADSRQHREKQRATGPDKEDESTDSDAVRKDVQAKDRSPDEPRTSEAVEAKPDDKKVDEAVSSKVDPPPYYRVKGKAAWDKLTDNERQLLVAREQEVSNGFAQVSERLRANQELEQVIAPRLPAIQRFGVTPAATVQRLFEWMEALSDSTRQVESFRRLAKSFRIDLSQLTELQSNQPDYQSQPQLQQAQEFNIEATPQYQGLKTQMDSVMQQIADQRQAAAAALVDDWAKDKPYYQHVSQLMAQLVQGGAIPLKNGNVDLDGAYEAAIKMHPEVSAHIQQEAATKAQKEAADKAAKDAKEKADKVAKARKASTGFKPAGPAAPMAPNQRSSLNGKKGPQSVRDSIAAAMSEVRDNA